MKRSSRRKSAQTSSFRKFLPQFEPLETRLVLDETSAGYSGIAARLLTTVNGALLTGSGISIGQVETGRPGKPGVDQIPPRGHSDVARARPCGSAGTRRDIPAAHPASDRTS